MHVGVLALNPVPMHAAIIGIGGVSLASEEARLFAAHPPAGVILFARNIADPSQLRALTTALRMVLPAAAVLMVDQEGGRVARLRPPHWRAHPPAAAIGALAARNAAAGRRAAWLTGALIGLECRAAGLDVVNAPVLDIAAEGAHPVIGDRAYAAEPGAVATLGAAMGAGLRAAGIQPVAKHIPGHGRATTDSHAELPRLACLTEQDLAPFIANAGLGWAMTSHIVYQSIDPVLPATLSPTLIATVIRGRCAFDGVLVSDDLDMRALSGAPGERAAAALAAGCDLVLHCTGDRADNSALLPACPLIQPAARRRMAAARDAAVATVLDEEALAAERDRLMASNGR